MTYQNIIESCNLVVPRNKGITPEEFVLLNSLPKITPLKKQNSTEFVTTVKSIVYRTLQRTNITPKDLKIVMLILSEV